MSEEKDLDQIENGDAGNDEGFGGLEDFVELDDLQNLEGLGDLSSLGDISDLGDLSDLEVVASGPLDDLDASGDVPLPVMEEAAVVPEAVQDVPEEEEVAVLPEEPETAEKFYISDKEELQAEPDIEKSVQKDPDGTEEPGELDLEITDGNDDSISNIEETIQEDDDNSNSMEETVQEEVPEEDSLGIMDEDSGENGEEDISLDDIALDAGEDIMPEDIPLDGDISLGQDIVPEETVPEEPEAVQEESMPEEAGSGMEPDIPGIDTIPGVEEVQAEAASPEQDSSGHDDGLDSMLDSLGVPETVSPASAGIVEDKEEAPQEEKAKEKKPGLFKRIFGNVVTDEIAEAERKAKEEEEQQAVLKAEEEAKAKEEKEAKKAAAAEAKEAKKAEKAAKKAEKAEEKAAKKAEKAAKKEAEKEEEEQEVVGKLNKAGVIIVVAGAAVILAGVIAGTNVFGYNASKSEAERYFSLQRYSEAYNEARGTKLEDKDPELYDKIVTVMKVQQSLDTYRTYSAMKYYPDALNALLRGLQKYDDNIDMAMDLEIEGDLKICRNRILSILKEEFGLSKKEAYNILSLDAGAYTKRVVGIAKKKI